MPRRCGICPLAHFVTSSIHFPSKSLFSGVSVPWPLVPTASAFQVNGFFAEPFLETKSQKKKKKSEKDLFFGSFNLFCV